MNREAISSVLHMLPWGRTFRVVISQLLRDRKEEECRTEGKKRRRWAVGGGAGSLQKPFFHRISCRDACMDGSSLQNISKIYILLGLQTISASVRSVSACVSVCLKAASLFFELHFSMCVNRVYFASVFVFTSHSVGLRVLC